MNNLTKEIVSHILDNFGILSPKTFNLINENNKVSELEFEDYSANIYCLQNNYKNVKIDVLAIDLCNDLIKEYILFFQVENTPAYILYYLNSKEYEDYNIFCHINDSWIECITYSQATLLAGIEQLKNINTEWYLNKDISKNIEKIKQFINFMDNDDE